MNTIRELKQQEKYKSMLKRKNKEKKIYKDKNASLQLEKQRLYIALRNKDKEIERLNNIINELEKYCIEEIEYYSKKIKSQYITDNTRGQYEGEKVCFEDILGRLQELKGDGSDE